MRYTDLRERICIRYEAVTYHGDRPRVTQEDTVIHISAAGIGVIRKKDRIVGFLLVLHDYGIIFHRRRRYLVAVLVNDVDHIGSLIGIRSLLFLLRHGRDKRYNHQDDYGDKDDNAAYRILVSKESPDTRRKPVVYGGYPSDRLKLLPEADTLFPVLLNLLLHGNKFIFLMMFSLIAFPKCTHKAYCII